VSLGVRMRGSGWWSGPRDCSVCLCCDLAFVMLLTVASGRTSLVLRIICWWLEASCGRLSAPSCCVFTLLAHHPVPVSVALSLPFALLCFVVLCFPAGVPQRVSAGGLLLVQGGVPPSCCAFASYRAGCVRGLPCVQSVLCAFCRVWCPDWATSDTWPVPTGCFSARVMTID
jgi:hypothetical protein